MSDIPRPQLIALAAQAEALKGSDAFALALAALEKEIVREWVAGTSTEVRERAHVKIDVLQSIVERLDEIIGAGAIEQDRQDRE